MEEENDKLYKEFEKVANDEFIHPDDLPVFALFEEDDRHFPVIVEHDNPVEAADFKETMYWIIYNQLINIDENPWFGLSEVIPDADIPDYDDDTVWRWMYTDPERLYREINNLVETIRQSPTFLLSISPVVGLKRSDAPFHARPEEDYNGGRAYLETPVLNYWLSSFVLS